MLLLRKMLRAARLDSALYREVRDDTNATTEALLVVILMVLGTVLGFVRPSIVLDLLAFVVIMVGLWMLWAWLAYLLATTIFRTPDTTATWGQMFRTAGYAQAPGALRIVLIVPLTFLPIVGQIMFLAIAVWQVTAMVVAVRQAMGYASIGRAVGVVLGGMTPFVFAILVLVG
jgi:hypothetical protein